MPAIPMRSYVGTKVVEARPLTRGDYNILRGWKLSADENPNDEGYFIAYHDGYVSWSPKATFDEAYHLTTSMTFGEAMTAAEFGRKIARSDWNAPNQFVVMMPALYLPPFNTGNTNRKVNDRTARFIGVDVPLDSQPYFALYNAQGKWQPGWVPTQGDMFSKKWVIVE